MRPGENSSNCKLRVENRKIHTRAPRTVPYATSNEHQIRTRLAGLKSFITPPTGTGNQTKKKRTRFRSPLLAHALQPFSLSRSVRPFSDPFSEPFSRQAGRPGEQPRSKCASYQRRLFFPPRDFAAFPSHSWVSRFCTHSCPVAFCRSLSLSLVAAALFCVCVGKNVCIYILI